MVFFTIFKGNTLTPGFEYGDLAALHPGEDYSQIKTRRKNNWTAFRAACLAGPVYLSAKRLELYQETTDSIPVSDGSTVTINGSANVIFYPFVPRIGTVKTFDINYGGNLVIKNTTMKCAQRLNLFESYQCTLKKSSNSRLIEILGSIRSDFWDSLEVGQEIFYSWSETVLGKTATVSSWDEGTRTITTSADIDAAVTNDTAGDQVWFGTDFRETVLESDYATYGRHWVRGQSAQGYYRLWNLIYHQPVASSGTNAYITLQNCTLQNFNNNIAISSGNFGVNIIGTVNIDYGEVSASVFARSQLNGQYFGAPTKETASGVVKMKGSGLNSVGSLDFISSQNIYGSGLYIHPTVIVNLIKFVGIDNPAYTFRQYSSSIAENTEYSSWIGTMEFSGSGEGDCKTSNSMPVTIDHYTGTSEIQIGGDLTLDDAEIIGGSIGFSSAWQPPSGATRTVLIKNSVFKLGDNFNCTWVSDRSNNLSITFDNCEFQATIYNGTTNQRIFKCDGDWVKELIFKDCSFVIPEGSTIQTWIEGQSIPSGDQAIRFIRLYNFKYVKFENFTTDYMVGTFIENTSSYCYPPNNDFTCVLNDCDIKTSKFIPTNISGTRTFLSTHFSGDRTIIRKPNFEGQGYNLPFSITPKTGSRTLSILSSLQYTNHGGSFTPTNVLMIDMGANEYYVNAGTINHIALASTQDMPDSLASLGDGEITIHAVGGDLVLNKWDANTNEYGNILNDLTIPSGTSATLTINSRRIFAKSTSIVNATLATGNGSVKEYKGVLSDYLLDVSGGFTISAGGVSGSADANGDITGTGIDAKSFVDYLTGTYYVLFDSNLGNGVTLDVTYTKYANWRITGAFE